MKKLIRSLSMILVVASLIGALVITAPFLDPPFTDQSVVEFIKSDIYLPNYSEDLTRADIAPALSKLLQEERKSYKTLFYLACSGLAGALGLLATPHTTPNKKQNKSEMATPRKPSD